MSIKPTGGNITDNAREIKNTYLSYLSGILYPFMYEGIKSLYDISVKSIDNAKNKNVTLLDTFKIYLKDVQNLTTATISNELMRIKQLQPYFSTALKATVKSYVVLLGKQNMDILKEYDDIKIDEIKFIKDCYVKLSGFIYNYPQIFIISYPSVNIQNSIFNDKQNIPTGNLTEIYPPFMKCLKKSVKYAIMNIVPINKIMIDYVNTTPLNDEKKLMEQLGIIVSTAVYKMLQVEILSKLNELKLKMDQVSNLSNLSNLSNYAQLKAEYQQRLNSETQEVDPDVHNVHNVIIRKDNIETTQQEDKIEEETFALKDALKTLNNADTYETEGSDNAGTGDSDNAEVPDNAGAGDSDKAGAEVPDKAEAIGKAGPDGKAGDSGKARVFNTAADIKMETNEVKATAPKVQEAGTDNPAQITNINQYINNLV